MRRRASVFACRCVTASVFDPPRPPPSTAGLIVAALPPLCHQFNFVGKILGPQGNTIKRLQEETGAKISVLGKGSMRDKSKVKKCAHQRKHLVLRTCELVGWGGEGGGVELWNIWPLLEGSSRR